MSSRDAARLSVVIAARDEATNIESCIETVQWADEVIVVENDSSDATLELARRAGANAFSHPFFTIGGQRNAAIERAKHPWILVVDADERCTPVLRDEIRSLLAGTPQYEAFRVPRRNYFAGREIRHGGWQGGRDRPIRLFRSSLRYDESRVHERVTVTAGAGLLNEPLLHQPYASLGQYFGKASRYSRWWAEDQYARGRRTGAPSVVLEPIGKFLGMYLLRGGWLDGPAGAVLAALSAGSVLVKYARLWEIGNTERQNIEIQRLRESRSTASERGG